MRPGGAHSGDSRDAVYWARWLLLPTALLCLLVLVPCSLAFIKQQYLQRFDFFWANADFWIPCLGGAMCGVLWMTIVIGLAPARKFTAGVISILPGAWLAWILIGESVFRAGESLSDPGFPTRAPVFVTWWAGLLGLALLWFRERRRSPHRVTPPPQPERRVLGFVALGLGVMLFCGLVLPAGFLQCKWAMYQWALHSLAEGDEAASLRRIQFLARIPGFDLDWTPGRILKHIPAGYVLDEKLFGCPSCRGIHTTLLQAAARHGRAEVVAWMVRRRGTVEYWNDRGRTLLDAGIGSKNPAVVGLLIDRGADATVTNRMGGVLHIAVMADAPAALMERLLAAGAPINPISCMGLTPLDCANIWQPQTIPFLVGRGATNAAVRVRLIPIPPGDRRFLFEGTPFGLQLPRPFSPVNRVQTPPDCLVWEVRTDGRSSLRFSTGKETKASGAETDFYGFAGVSSHDEYDWGDGKWSAHGSVAFDSRGHTHAELRALGLTPRYDSVFEYDAFGRRDLKLIAQALESFQRMPDTTEPLRQDHSSSPAR